MDGKFSYQSSQTSSRDSLRREPHKKSTKAGVLALIRGLANQIVVQLRLASEFGIPYSQIFSDDFRGLSRAEIERLIVDWLRSGDEGLDKINQLGNDLLAHQIAVISGLDGIAKQTLNNLDPQRLQNTDKGMLSTKKNWSAFMEAYRELNENIVKRHQQIVVPGFASTYIKARENQSRHPVEIEPIES